MELGSRKKKLPFNQFKINDTGWSISRYTVIARKSFKIFFIGGIYFISCHFKSFYSSWCLACNVKSCGMCCFKRKKNSKDLYSDCCLPTYEPPSIKGTYYILPTKK